MGSRSEHVALGLLPLGDLGAVCEAAMAVHLSMRTGTPFSPETHGAMGDSVGGDGKSQR